MAVQEKPKGILLVETIGYSPGSLVSFQKNDDEGYILENGDWVSEDNFMPLNEHLTKEDEAKVRAMIKTQLKLMFCRLWTRSSFITQ